MDCYEGLGHQWFSSECSSVIGELAVVEGGVHGAHAQAQSDGAEEWFPVFWAGGDRFVEICVGDGFEVGEEFGVC